MTKSAVFRLAFDMAARLCTRMPLAAAFLTAPRCALVFAAMLAGCADSIPMPGELVAVEVYEQLTVDKMRHGRQIDVANAIAQGMDEADIEAGRLAVLTCASPRGDRNPDTKWVVLLPQGMTLREGDVVSFSPGTRYGREGPLGTVTGRLPSPPPEELYVWKYGKSVRCGEPARDGSMQARYAFAFGGRDIKEHRLHRERMRGVSDEEVRAGRIVLARCSQMTDGWTEWTVRVPAGLQLGRGDYALARAGVPDHQLHGDISEAIRKIPEPDARQTYYVQGSHIIRCNATLAPR